MRWDPATGSDFSAGTPDRVSPDGIKGFERTWAHFVADVQPAFAALALGELEAYMEHRPPSNGGGKTCGGSKYWGYTQFIL